MAQLDTQILPLLPLTSGVVLPGMVVTLTIESDEARRAIAASESSDGELLPGDLCDRDREAAEDVEVEVIGDGMEHSSDGEQEQAEPHGSAQAL